jgi:peptide/nickel transport system substrate-binding protein/oligopeptide transport system substrate-binding protein
MNKNFLYILILILVLSISSLACSKKGATSKVSEKKVILALQSDINSFDPAFSVDVASGKVLSKLYSALFTFDSKGKLIGDAAENWKLSKDGRIYTIKLKEGLTFSNGMPLSSEDAFFTFNRLADPKTASPRSWIMQNVAGYQDFQNKKIQNLTGLKVIDPYTLEITLSKPFSPFISLLAMVGSYILPSAENGKYSSKEYLAKQPCGTGPYILKKRSANNFIHITPKNKNMLPIVFRIIPEASTRIAEFRANNLDMISVPPIELPYFKKTFPKQLKSVQKLNVYYLGMNNQSKIFKNKKIRQAMNFAVNRKAIVDNLLDGSAILAEGPVPPVLLRSPEKYAYSFSPEKAKDLLKEAGLETPLEIEIWQRSGNSQRDALIAIAEDLKVSGFAPKIVTMEWSALKENINKGNADCFFMSWSADYPDAENFLYPLFHSSNFGSNGNRAFYSDPEIDSLLEKAAAAPSIQEQKALYTNIRDKIIEQAPWVFLWHEIETFAFSNKIVPFSPNPIFNAENGSNFKLRP